jgi:hypothetical protein
MRSACWIGLGQADALGIPQPFGDHYVGDSLVQTRVKATHGGQRRPPLVR